MPLDDKAVRALVRERLREIGDMVDELLAVDDDLLPDYTRSGWESRHRMWGCVEAVIWRLVQQKDPDGWSGWSPDGLHLVKAAWVDDRIHAWGMASFLSHGGKFFLSPFWVRIEVTATSVALNADVGERDVTGRPVRYESGDPATTRREVLVVDEAEVIRWAYEISAYVDRAARAT